MNPLLRVQRALLPLLFTMASCLGLGAAAAQLGAAFDQKHVSWDRVLKKRVREAGVDYAGLKADRRELDDYLSQLAVVTRTEFKQWTEPDQIAFLCNAYNACTLRLIVDHYPVKSIKNIGRLFQGPWDQPVVPLFGDAITLNTLEHGILRQEYDEPRLHFVLVCAAKGCPPLRAEAYTGTRLEEQLSDQIRIFLGNTSKNRVNVGERTLHLSPIFKWYAADFEKKHGSVQAAVERYWPVRTGMSWPSDLKIRYTDYDWSLNDLRR